LNNETHIVSHELIVGCRICGSGHLAPVIEFGETPLADRLLTEITVVESEPVCPLSVVFCENCSLLQIRETVDPTVLFSSDYPYYSSVSAGLMQHFRENVVKARKRRPVTADSLVIEVASNDGYLLRNYRQSGIPVLGIDPTDGPVREARRIGIETIHDFFSDALAADLQDQGRTADIVHGNNVLAHVADTNGFVSGLGRILKDDGLIVVECPYVYDLVTKCEFDTIYHQHLCYFSLHALRTLFGRHELFINDLQKVAVHGGTLRLFIEKRDMPTAAVLDLLAFEEKTGMTGIAFYEGFRDRITAVRDNLTDVLKQLKRDGARIAGYGAPAKACTLMTFAGIDGRHVDYLVDKSRFKQGLFYPGNHLPIFAPERLRQDSPDYALLLSWNFATEILREQSEFRNNGGKFIVPIPELKVL
jgi:SAM-dependent methyltransferase